MTEYNRNDPDQVLKERIRNIELIIAEAKSKSHSSVTYPYYIPTRPDRLFDDFKKNVLNTLKGRGYHVTNFLPGQKEAFRGVMKDIMICFDDESRKQAETEGIVFY